MIRANAETEAALTRANAETESAQRQAARANMAENQLAALTNSTSWRLTGPIRSVVHWGRRLLRGPPPGLPPETARRTAPYPTAPGQMPEWDMISFRILGDDALMTVREKAAFTRPGMPEASMRASGLTKSRLGERT